MNLPTLFEMLVTYAAEFKANGLVAMLLQLLGAVFYGLLLWDVLRRREHWNPRRTVYHAFWFCLFNMAFIGQQLNCALLSRYAQGIDADFYTHIYIINAFVHIGLFTMAGVVFAAVLGWRCRQSYCEGQPRCGNAGKRPPAPLVEGSPDAAKPGKSPFQ